MAPRLEFWRARSVRLPGVVTFSDNAAVLGFAGLMAWVQSLMLTPGSYASEIRQEVKLSLFIVSDRFLGPAGQLTPDIDAIVTW